MNCRNVAVIGGGLAGIAAALRCADAGTGVTLYEARPRLGGLTCSFRRGQLWVDNGQHVFLRCCTSYRALLERLGVAEMTTLQPRMNIAVRGRLRAGRLRRTGLPAPLHLSGSLARYPWLGLAERVQFARAAMALRGVDTNDPAVDQCSFGGWLQDHGQSIRSVRNLWELVGTATLNARAEDASLALAATVFQIGMLTENCGADVGWANVPLQRLHGDAAAAALIGSGARVYLQSKVKWLRRGSAWSATSHRIDTGWVVGTENALQEFDDVVLAVPPVVAESLLPVGAVPLEPGWSARLGSSPIVNLHLVLDRPVLDEPFVAGVESDVQWIFDRTRQSGLTSGQYLAVSLSAADDYIDTPTVELRDRFLPELRHLLPQLANAALRDFFVTRERDATFRPAPGTGRLRPSARTLAPGLYLAGAWTATGWPATMEGAVRSGDSAAFALLSEPGAESTEAA